jgi:hypothetical protein
MTGAVTTMLGLAGMTAGQGGGERALTFSMRSKNPVSPPLSRKENVNNTESFAIEPNGLQ